MSIILPPGDSRSGKPLHEYFNFFFWSRAVARGAQRRGRREAGRRGFDPLHEYNNNEEIDIQLFSRPSATGGEKKVRLASAFKSRLERQQQALVFAAVDVREQTRDDTKGMPLQGMTFYTNELKRKHLHYHPPSLSLPPYQSQRKGQKQKSATPTAAPMSVLTRLTSSLVSHGTVD